MKSFNIKRLIGVFVVSATVLLTGCNIEALGNFGKATSNLSEFNSSFKSYDLCVLSKKLDFSLHFVDGIGPSPSDIAKYNQINIEKNCEEYRTLDALNLKLNNSLAIYGQLLSDFQKNSEIDYTLLIKKLGETSSFISGEDFENLKKIGKGKLSPEALEGTSESVSKLGDIFKNAILAISKRIMKKGIVVQISSRIKEANPDFKNVVALLRSNNDEIEMPMLKEMKNLKNEIRIAIEQVLFNPEYKEWNPYVLEAMEKADRFYPEYNNQKINFQKGLAEVEGGWDRLYQKAMNEEAGTNRFDGEEFKINMEELVKNMGLIITAIKHNITL